MHDTVKLSDLVEPATATNLDSLEPSEVVIYSAELVMPSGHNPPILLLLCPTGEGAPARREDAFVFGTSSPYVAETLRRLGLRKTGAVADFRPPIAATLTRARGQLVIS